MQFLLSCNAPISSLILQNVQYHSNRTAYGYEKACQRAAGLGQTASEENYPVTIHAQKIHRQCHLTTRALTPTPPPLSALNESHKVPRLDA